MSVSVRPLRAEEARLLTAARLVAVEHAPYLAHALFATHPAAAEGLGTFAVDRGWRLYLDPASLAGWGPSLAGGVLVHEAGHLVRAHAERADALGADVDHERWNLSADLAINDDLLAAGVPLPAGAVTPAAFGLAEGGIEEVYYAALAQEADTSTASSAVSDPAGGCGSGAGDPPAPWELPTDDPTAPAVGPADASMTRRRVAEAAQRIERLLAEADAQTREMLERYGGLFPVTFGHCGYAGLCVRGTTRAFGIGCEYLVRRPEYLYRVDYFLDSYTATAEAHERMGDIAGARERRRLAAELQQLRHEMVLLAEAERQGATPAWKALPPGYAG